MKASHGMLVRDCSLAVEMRREEGHVNEVTLDSPSISLSIEKSVSSLSVH